MLQSIFDWFGSITGFGIDPLIPATFGFLLFIFAISEFFRLLEIIVVHISRR